MNPQERWLRLNGAPIDLNARYLDALLLLVQQSGRLITKDQFLEQTWRGVPVTDEALTQCIKILRRQLGDTASNPRFIETVPKHGYRFVAEVEWRDASIASEQNTGPRPFSWRQFLLLGGAGTLGAGAAGLLGGVLLGFAAALQAGMGAASVLIVLMGLSVLIALIGGAGVAFGIAATGFINPRPSVWTLAGGAAGGLVIGAFVKLVGLDAFHLLFGQSPGDITGAVEGLVLGAVTGVVVWWADRCPAPGKIVAVAALAGAVTGSAITLLGGRLLGGSLDLLTQGFPDANLRLDAIGEIFGETGFGPISQVVTGAAEGALFVSGVVVAISMAGRSSQRQPDQ